MTLLLRTCLFTPLLLLLGLFSVFTLCIESSPLVTQQVQLSPANIDRVKRLLRQHKPENLRSGETRSLTLSEKELNLIATYLARRFHAAGAVLKISQGSLSVSSSWNISAHLPYQQDAASYLNVEAVLVNREGSVGLNSLTIQSLNIGRLTLPSFFVEPLLKFSRKRLDAIAGLPHASSVLQAIDFRRQEVTLSYQWQAGLFETLRGRLLSVEERQAIASHHQFLVLEVDRQGRGLTFTSLLEATFRFAHKRSQNAEPVLENKAAIIVLAAYANGGGLSALIPESKDWPRPRRAKLRLEGRHDLVQHFMTSAALAVAGGAAVSNAIGLRKEMDDASQGSGFSFKDLAADMAGTRFAALAVASSISARRLQLNLAIGHDKAQLLPPLQDLRENLKRSQFQSRYGGVWDPRYRRVVKDIETRIDALRVYR